MLTGGGGAALGDGAGAGLAVGSGDATAGLGDGVDAGVGEGLGVSEGVGFGLSGAAATTACEEGAGVPLTDGEPVAMAATTIAIRANGATNAEAYASDATTIFHAVFERYPGILAYQGGGAVVAA